MGVGVGDIEVSHLMAIDNFHKNCLFWSYLLKFNKTLQEVRMWGGDGGMLVVGGGEW